MCWSCLSVSRVQIFMCDGKKAMNFVNSSFFYGG
jgi:hypothetical protein